MAKIKEVSFLSKEQLEILKLAKEYKLTISSVKYSEGHDEGMPVTVGNFKIGTVIKGSYKSNGETPFYDFTGDKIQQVLDICEKIKEKVPTFNNCGETYTTRNETIAELLREDYHNKKDCKKKAQILAVTSPYPREKRGPIPKIKELEYPCSYSQLTDEKIANDLAKKGYVEFEIINKRIAA